METARAARGIDPGYGALGLARSADFGLAERLAERILQLGGHPEYALDVLDPHCPGKSNSQIPINDKRSSNLVAGRIAVARREELLTQLGSIDLANSRLLYGFLLADAVHKSSSSQCLRSCQPQQEHHAMDYYNKTVPGVFVVPETS